MVSIMPESLLYSFKLQLLLLSTFVIVIDVSFGQSTSSSGSPTTTSIIAPTTSTTTTTTTITPTPPSTTPPPPTTTTTTTAATTTSTTTTTPLTTTTTTTTTTQQPSTTSTSPSTTSVDKGTKTTPAINFVTDGNASITTPGPQCVNVTRVCYRQTYNIRTPNGASVEAASKVLCSLHKKEKVIPGSSSSEDIDKSEEAAEGNEKSSEQSTDDDLTLVKSKSLNITHESFLVATIEITKGPTYEVTTCVFPSTTVTTTTEEVIADHYNPAIFRLALPWWGIVIIVGGGIILIFIALGVAVKLIKSKMDGRIATSNRFHSSFGSPQYSALQSSRNGVPLQSISGDTGRGTHQLPPLSNAPKLPTS